MALVHTIPTGMIAPWPTDTPPTCWLLCDGSMHDCVDYPKLYAIIGNIYGGAGPDTFAVPDLRDRSVIGVSPGALDLYRPSARAIAETGGQEAVRLTADQCARAAHSHAAGGIYDAFAMASGGDTWLDLEEGSQPVGSQASTAEDPAVEASEDVPTQMPWLAMHWIIKT